ncbi:MAG: AEC family transporter [Oscillospiraceae bacterium]|nr:AEC family transporter [Oscillospiraceae bacterium]
MQVINTVAAFLVLIAIGWFVAKRKWVNDDFAKGVAKVLFNIMLPSLIIISMQYEFTPEILVTSGALILVAFAVVLVGLLIGWLFSVITGVKTYLKRIITSVMGFSNFSFMGYPVAYAVYGAEGLFYAVIFSLPFFVLAQSVGNIILNEKGKFGLKKLLNPPIIAVLTGFALFVLSIELPSGIYITLELVGRSTVPLAMLLAGLLLAGAPLKAMFGEWRYFAVSALRLVLYPLLLFVVLRLLGFEGMMLGVPVIITMMPAAVKIIVSAANFDGDAVAAAQIIMVSTILSVITVPLMVWFLL